MRSVLIVEDEYYIRVRVRKCVDWQAMGFDRIDECSNGQEALALMEEQSFDLMVADISMPIMDGLTLCENIRKLNLETLVILLTGYDKFEYAQLAVSYDVVEYILKPVDSQEMEKAVRKASRIIDDRTFLKGQKQERDKLLAQNILLERELYLGTVLSDGYHHCPSHAKRMEGYGVHPNMTYCVVYSDLQTPDATASGDAGISLTSGRAWIIEENALVDLLYELQANRINHVLGVSAAHYGTPEGIFLACREARLISCQQIFGSDKALLYYGKFAAAHESVHQGILLSCREAFDTALLSQNQDQAEATLLKGLAQLTSVLDVYLFIETILTSMHKNAIREECGWDGSALFKMQAFDMLCNSESISELQDLLLKMVNEFFAKKRSFCFTAGLLIVKKVRQIVNRHFMEEDLSVGAIAEALSLNASYLSDAFGRCSGQPLSQYINQVRMEKARELLADETLSLVDVMEQVGYKDPYYFSKRFKRYFGCSHSVYRGTSKQL